MNEKSRQGRKLQFCNTDTANFQQNFDRHTLKISDRKDYRIAKNLNFVDNYFNFSPNLAFLNELFSLTAQNIGWATALPSPFPACRTPRRREAEMKSRHMAGDIDGQSAGQLANEIAS